MKSWGIHEKVFPLSDSNFRIHLNADATQTSLQIHSFDEKGVKKSSTAMCTQIPSTEQTVAFDTVCDFKMTKGFVLRVIGVNRENFGNDLDTVRFKFRDDS